MKIGIDARLYGLEHTGIGRYVMELIHWLIKIDHHNSYTLFVNSQTASQVPSKENFKKKLIDIRHYSLKEQTHFPSIIRQSSLDLIHFPHFNVPLLMPVPFIVTIHDLLWHDVVGYKVTTLNPALYSLKYFIYRLVVRNAIKRSRCVITPSRWVKDQVISRFSINSTNINVINEGAGWSIPQEPQSAPTSLPKVKAPYLVYTGSLYPHKNVATLIRALKLVNQKPGSKIRLILASSRSIFTPKIKRLVSQLGQQKYVIFAGFLSDQDLSRLYQEALALVQPSTSEGFGLTGLEAMKSGTPVISSTSASLPEVYEEAALYFNPKNSQDLANKINQLRSDKKLSAQLIKTGNKHVQKYSWKKMAQQTLKSYEQIYNSTKR